MSSFILDRELIDRINQELPNLENLGMIVRSLSPNAISIKYHPDSNIPIASVCLNDTLDSLYNVRIGLNECLENKIWYREKYEPPSEELAIIFMRFYLQATVAQLYAAGEHLANAIICMLELTENQLSKYRNRRTSQQSILGNYLAAEQPDTNVGNAVSALANSKEWRESMSYRSESVHEQPPTVSGLGPTYLRQRRWHKSDGTGWLTLGLSGGDQPRYSIDDVLRFVQPATFQFIKLFDNITHIYLEMLIKKGIYVTDQGLKVSIIGKTTGT